jgi:AcrR family transcriptional regulator
MDEDLATGNGTLVGSLRDRSRQVASQEILRTALRLFVDQGFDETTVAQIAKEAGVSQRTLFRYFGSKEDLVGGSEDVFSALLTDAVQAQPAEADVWGVMRAAFAAALTVHVSAEEALRRFRLVHGTGSLHSAYLGKRARSQEVLLPLIEARMLSAEADRAQARAVIATAFACFEAAVTTWVECEGKGDLLDIYDRSMGVVRRL